MRFAIALTLIGVIILSASLLGLTLRDIAVWVGIAFIGAALVYAGER